MSDNNNLLGIYTKTKRFSLSGYIQSDHEERRRSRHGSGQSRSEQTRDHGRRHHNTLPKLDSLQIKVSPGVYDLKPTGEYDDTMNTQHAAIQHAWTTFTGLSDSLRNVMLKGLLQRCSSQQIQLICSELNLKSVNSMCVHPFEAYQKMLASCSYKTYRHQKPDVFGFAGKDIGSLAGAKLPMLERASHVMADFNTDQTSVVSSTNNDEDKSVEDSTGELVEIPHPQSRKGSHNHNHNQKDRKSTTTTPQPASLVNSNMYIRLINNSFDYQTIVSHAEKLGPKTSRKCVEFLALRCSKLHSLVQCLNAIANREDVTQAPLMQFLRGLKSVLKAEHCSIYLLEDSSYAVVKASTFADIDMAIPLNSIVGGVEISGGETMVNVFNTKSSEYYRENTMKQHYSFDVLCVLSFPIRDHNSKTYGIIEVVNKTSGPPFFDAEDEGMLKIVTNFWNLLIRVPNSESTNKARTDDIKVLINTASLLSADSEMEDIIKMLNPTARDLLGAERALTFVLDEDTGELWSSLCDGSEQLRLPPRKGIPGYVAATNEVMNVSNVDIDKRFYNLIDLKTNFKTYSCLCVPLRNSKGRTIGVFEVANKKITTVFSKEDEILLTSLSGLASIIIEKSIYFKGVVLAQLEALRKRDFYQHILTASPCALFVIDTFGKTVYMAQLENFDLVGHQDVIESSGFQLWLVRNNPLLAEDMTQAFGLQEGESIRRFCTRVSLFDKLFTVNYYMAKIKSSSLDDAVDLVVLQIENLSQVKRLQLSLSRYFPSDFAHIAPITKDPILEGTRQTISVLHCSLSNYSSFDEVMEPGEFALLWNKLVGIIGQAVQEVGGFLDKVIGGSVLACFGIPSNRDFDSCALINISLKLKTILNKQQKIKGDHRVLPTPVWRIAITTGAALVSHIAFENHWELNVSGEPLKLAHKMAKASSLYHSGVVACQATHSLIKDFFHVRELDCIRIGKTSSPFLMYEILGSSSSELNQDHKTSVLCYELGLIEYRTQNWQAAVIHFKKSVQLSEDPAAKVLINRLKYIADHPQCIPTEWDGIWDIVDEL